MRRIDSSGSEANSYLTPLVAGRVRNSLHLDNEVVHEEEKTELSFSEITFESKEVDLLRLRELSSYVEKRYKDAIYLGTMNGDMRDGKGIMRYANGR